jgi:hypothetical protein
MPDMRTFAKLGMIAALVKHDPSGLKKGLVYAFPIFQHRGAVHDIKIEGVPGVDAVHMNGGTSNLQAGEIFQIRGGKIHEIEAMGASLPYGTKSPWD